MSIEARLRKLEKQRDAKPVLVVLFGDDQLPEGTPSTAVVLHFEEEDRGL